MNHLSEKIKRNIEKAKEELKETDLLFKGGMYSGSVCRAYYAVFHAACAVLITKNLEFSKHSAVISAFGQHFVKTGGLKEALHATFKETFEARQLADYDIFKETTKDFALNLKLKAEDFVSETIRYLKSKKAID